MYDEPRALLQRPWRVTKLFWEVTPESQREFVADPREGSYPILDVPFAEIPASATAR